MLMIIVKVTNIFLRNKTDVVAQFHLFRTCGQTNEDVK